MNFEIPESITLIEVGPRDGFQFESKIIPMDLKAQIIDELALSGLSHIQVASFVHPKKVPQMADAEKLIEMLPKREDVIYSALVLNSKGVERAAAAGISHVEISISASETHGKNNAGMSVDEAISHAGEMIRLAKKHGMKIRAGAQCCFGCFYEGEVAVEQLLKIFGMYLDLGADMICLSDTTGMATPPKLESILKEVMPMAGHIPVMLHLHDTRGIGLVNVMTAMANGVAIFDTAFGGMGGCPFVKGASGNIATEDTLYFLESLGIKTGVDKEAVARCSKKMEKFLGKKLSGKMYNLL